MKKHLKMGKLHLFHGSIEQAIMENKKNNDELFTVASLLDHMDWMDKAMVTSELSLLWERIDKQRGRFYWRSFSENVHIPPLVWLNPTKVDDIYINTMNDRVGMYFSTWIASTQDTQFAITARCKSWSNRDYEAGMAEKLVTGAKIITAPVWKKVMHQQVQEGSSKHEKDMEAFYRYQKDGKWRTSVDVYMCVCHGFIYVCVYLCIYLSIFLRMYVCMFLHSTKIPEI